MDVLFGVTSNHVHFIFDIVSTGHVDAIKRRTAIGLGPFRASHTAGQCRIIDFKKSF